VPIYLAAADVLVLPYNEDDILAASGPLSMAMGSGKPVVASRIARFENILKNGVNSLLVPTSDPDSLAKSINLLLENSELAAGLARELALLGKATSWTTVANRTVALYGELIAQRGQSQMQSR